MATQRGEGVKPFNTLPAQWIDEQSETKLARLGQRLVLDDRVFRYCKASEALTSGELCTCVYDTDAEDTVTVAHPIDTTEVTITAASAITAAQYEDGYLVVDEGTAAGEMYKIRSNPVIANGVTGVITLYDGLRSLWAIADTDITLYTSPFHVQVSNSDQKETPAGVPLIDVTSGYYFWLQTAGPCACLLDEAEGADANQALLTIGSSTAGSVECYDGAGEPIVGMRYPDTADYEDAKFQLIKLMLE